MSKPSTAVKGLLRFGCIFALKQATEVKSPEAMFILTGVAASAALMNFLLPTKTEGSRYLLLGFNIVFVNNLIAPMLRNTGAELDRYHLGLN